MNRRRILASSCSLLMTGATGCGALSAFPDMGEACGPADTPVSERLVDTPGPSSGCAPPPLVITNEREMSVTIVVSIEETTIDERTYDLPGGGRILESLDTNTPPETRVRVELPKGVYERRWTAESCLRKAIAIVDADVRVGWLKPLQGFPDAIHDCYAGDDAVLRFWNKSGAGPIDFTATATNRCTHEKESRSFTISDQGVETIHGLVTSGGRYRVHTSVDAGQQATFQFPDDGHCWGMVVTYTGDDFEAHPIGVY